MPELPDVERSRQYLNSTSLHQEIAEVEEGDPMVLEEVTEADLREALVGTELVNTRRHGKWLLAETADESWLCVHFGMTGSFVSFKDMADRPEHVRALVSFTNGMHLAYDCQRRLGRISLAPGVEEFVERKGLGPDARDLSLEAFSEAIEGRSARMKPLLMDQTVIAGLGNIIVDEILFRCRVHPEQPVDALDEAALREIHRTMTEIVEHLILVRTGHEDEIPDDWLMRHRDVGDACPGCGGEIERIEVGGRGTYLCPACQKRK